MIRVPNSLSLALLGELVGVGGLFAGALIKLFKNDIVPGEESTIATFTAADFTGYAPSAAVTWGTPGVSGDGTPQVLGDTKVFTAGTPLTQAGTVYGVYVTNTAGTVLLYAERFAQPVLISIPGQQVAYTPKFSLISQAG